MSEVRGPADALAQPRFSGLRTFARLPTLEQTGACAIAVLGAPFDAGVSFRPGPRFGPAAIRDASILLRPWHEALGIDTFATVQVADAGDAPASPVSIADGHEAIRAAAAALHATGAKVIGLGGDHSVALPLMRAAAERHGPLALIQFDAHSDTWDSYFGEKVTHGTIMRRAAEEGVVDAHRSTQLGIRGPLYSGDDLGEARSLGFTVETIEAWLDNGVERSVADAVSRTADAPVYVSVDVDVLDPAFAPGTGTPEPGGLQTRELQAALRTLAPLAGRIVAGDVVEVSPPFDQGAITAAAGANLAWELLALMVAGTARMPEREEPGR